MALRLSQEEFTRGVQTYSRDMYRAARALTPCDADAQDAVGQAVLLAWQSLDRLRDPEALRAWLVKISVNCARQLNRRSRREVYLEDLPPQAAAREDLRPELWDAVLSLPRDQRAAVVLYYYEDLPVADIASLLRVPAGTGNPGSAGPGISCGWRCRTRRSRGRRNEHERFGYPFAAYGPGGGDPGAQGL